MIINCVETGRKGSDQHWKSSEYKKCIETCWEEGTVNAFSAAAQITVGRACAMRSNNIEGIYLNHMFPSTIGDWGCNVPEIQGIRFLCYHGKMNRAGILQETGELCQYKLW